MCFRWTGRLAILTTLAVIGLCLCSLTYMFIGRRVTDETHNHVRRSVKRGMSRAQVLEILNHEGEVYIANAAQGYNAWLPGRPPLSLIELVFVQPAWWYPHKVGFFFAYDYSDSLTEFWLFD